jgi:hypothetical protein
MKNKVDLDTLKKFRNNLNQFIIGLPKELFSLNRTMDAYVEIMQGYLRYWNMEVINIKTEIRHLLASCPPGYYLPPKVSYLQIDLENAERNRFQASRFLTQAENIRKQAAKAASRLNKISMTPIVSRIDKTMAGYEDVISAELATGSKGHSVMREISFQTPEELSGVRKRSKKVSPLNKKDWTALDGTELHNYYETAVEDALDETAVRESGNREVHSEMLTSAGEVDTFIQRGQTCLVLDYKTHDMFGWSKKDAERYGDAHGRQVREYINAICAEKNISHGDISGVIIIVNRIPEKAAALKAYSTALANFGIQIEICANADDVTVVDTVKRLVDKYNV